MNIQWYPGHMTKTRRMIGENLKYVDVVAEVIDARIPIASRNPDLDELVGGKPRVVILNRADQADPAASKVWGAYFRAQGISVLECDARSGAGVKQFSPVMRAALKEQIARWKEKGQVGRPVRAMVVGVPNVGKSTFINKVARKKSAKAGDRPGVTRSNQWVRITPYLELLDTPGLLWPNLSDQQDARALAFVGTINDNIMDQQMLAIRLMERLVTFMGCADVVFSDPAAHDERIAYTSQLMHVMALALCDQHLLFDSYGFEGGSFRGATRVAALDPKLWCELFWANKETLANLTDELTERLAEYSALLHGDDRAALLERLTVSSDRKKKFDALRGLDASQKPLFK